MTNIKGHQTNTGRTHFKKGMTPWNKGLKGILIPWNKGLKGYLSKERIGEGNPMFGKHHTERAKKNISNHLSKWLEKDGYKSLIKQQTSKEPTSIEKKVYEELKNRGLLFEKQKLVNGKFLVDAYVPSLNLIIEADGDYWHSLEKVQKRDKAKNAYLTKCGFNLLRLSETEINNGSFKERMVN
mgnify:CR=1 FL=1